MKFLLNILNHNVVDDLLKFEKNSFSPYNSHYIKRNIVSDSGVFLCQKNDVDVSELCIVGKLDVTMSLQTIKSVHKVTDSLVTKIVFSFKCVTNKEI